METTVVSDKSLRSHAAARGRSLELITIAWSLLEAAVALTAAAKDHSISLTGFGLDSMIEVVSAVALLWRMSHEMDHRRRHRSERISLRIAGGCLIALGGYLGFEAGLGLWKGHHAETGWLGIAITAAALVCMPVLAHAKRKVGRALASPRHDD